jgi:hypothetical protein
VAPTTQETPESVAIPESNSTVFLAHPQVQHLLPLRWSLSNALSRSEWDDLRARLRKHTPEQPLCSCPKRCPTNTIDELWECDSTTATKRFRGGQWLCPGCHWLKSPAWRLETWGREQSGSLRPLSMPPHLFDCLGWTPAQVEELRSRDLANAERQNNHLKELSRGQRRGEVLLVPTSWRRLTSEQREDLVQLERRVALLWDIDLSALKGLGYSPGVLERFTQKMLALGRTRMLGNLG